MAIRIDLTCLSLRLGTAPPSNRCRVILATWAGVEDPSLIC